MAAPHAPAYQYNSAMVDNFPQEGDQGSVDSVRQRGAPGRLESVAGKQQHGLPLEVFYSGCCC
jgi:hypothetical protein